MGAPQGNRQRPSRRDRGLSDLAQIRHLDLACAGIRARRRHFCAQQSPPTWDDISKLAVIATIRTMLNYFLAKDISAFDQYNNQAPRGES